jgi:hypothetical protein
MKLYDRISKQYVTYVGSPGDTLKGRKDLAVVKDSHGSWYIQFSKFLTKSR